ncbi:glycosyltransferase family 4 protein [Piscinibacter sp. XHJ-5]|uniref:glycosyltransferase family 4 protein n=1 Tax=Piscinibacter sp. XHJ-5 TaxID=3037797 RepID=UPI00245312E8|nr:glycosyltransferase family 4 protein [Piscinibacter sp. XHJ-5]
MSADPRLKVVIVSEHASARFGGEAALPLHYFRVLRARGEAVWLVTHARTRDELNTLFPGETRIRYIEDTRLNRLMWRIAQRLPAQIAYFTVGFVSRFATQLAQRRVVRELVQQHGIDVVHQPMPVSPREPSMMFGFGVPVLIGPMNGGMEYPPAFARHRGRAERSLLAVGRWSAAVLNALMPGKRRAATLLVANARTRHALPAGVCPRVVELVENGVDLSLWRDEAPAERVDGVPLFAFVGRLVDWKAVDVLLEAFRVASQRARMGLVIIGDGVQRASLERLAHHLCIAAVPQTPAGEGVRFTGWLPQSACAERLRDADVLVLPSLLECGGAVVLEAMAMGKPVIATAWGGPLDYLDERCGVLVRPANRAALVRGLADAMVRLAASPELRRSMGRHGREKALRDYDWEVKVDRMLALYREACHGARGSDIESARAA